MRHSEFKEYWIPACKNLYGPIPTSSEKAKNYYKELDKALGIFEASDYFVTPFFDDPPMPEGLKYLLRLLAGPNGKTVLKMYQIKMGAR